MAKNEEVVREQVKQMTGFKSAEDMADALPENTMQPMFEGEGEPPRQKRKKRTKAEMAAYRASMGIPDPYASTGSVEPSMDDPLMADPRYRKAVEKMRTAGMTNTIDSGFSTAALITQDEDWKLQKEEWENVDDFSYVVSKKFPILDPTHHWFSMLLYFLALMGTLIFKRAAKMNAETWMKKLHDMFLGEDVEKTAQEIADEKEQSR